MKENTLQQATYVNSFFISPSNLRSLDHVLNIYREHNKEENLIGAHSICTGGGIMTSIDHHPEMLIDSEVLGEAPWQVLVKAFSQKLSFPMRAEMQEQLCKNP